MFTKGRREITLNGKWKFNPDPYQRCRQQKWWKGEGDDDRFFPCFNIEGLWDINVPSTFNKEYEELKWYSGYVNYVKDFEIEEIPKDYEAFICFDGVVYEADIYLNGQSLGSHKWGYSPFQLRATKYLKKKNRIFVLVDNHLSKDRVPGIRCDWNNDGGIINEVKLIFVPKIYIENFKVETKIKDEDVYIKFQAVLQSRDKSLIEKIEFKVPELDICTEIIGVVGEKVSSTVKISKDKIKLWCPENPKLYKTIVSTTKETLCDDLGYREIKTKERKVLLNGKEIRLYGVAVHSEFKDTGRSATIKGIREMIDKAKDMGLNFLRCAHYPYSDIFAREMDKAGLLWWEEVPVYWLTNIHLPHMTEKAMGMLEETIKRDHNRASLIIWSLSNECAGDGGEDNNGLGPNYPYWFKAAKMVRELDSSRLISSADSGHRKTMNSSWTPNAGDEFDNDICEQKWIPGHSDSFYDLFDILSANLYVQNPKEGLIAYHKLVEMLKDYNKPIIISEFGSMSTDDIKSDENMVGNPIRHEIILREAYKSFRELPEIIGYVPWCLMDVRAPMHWRWYNMGKGVFRYGLLDENWNEKHVYNVVKEEIIKLKEVYHEGGGLNE